MKTMKNIAQRKKQINFSRSKQRGFVLQELAIAVVIIAVIGTAAFAAYRVLNSDNAVDNERDAITSEVTRGLAATDTLTDTSTVTTALLIANNVFKQGVSGTTVKNKFSGQTTVAPASTAFGTNDALQWTKTGYTSEACTDVTRKIQSLAYSITVNGTPVKTDTTDFDTAALGGACNKTNNNTVVYVTARR